jgi:hypothetical protein
MDHAIIYVNAGLISWQPLSPSNSDFEEALIEIDFSLPSVWCSKSGWSGTVVFAKIAQNALKRHPA